MICRCAKELPPSPHGQWHYAGCDGSGPIDAIAAMIAEGKPPRGPAEEKIRRILEDWSREEKALLWIMLKDGENWSTDEARAVVKRAGWALG